MTTGVDLIEFVRERTGIELSRGGLKDALFKYAERRQHELGYANLTQYRKLLEAPDCRELRRLIEIISVPHTWFFRDPEQLELAAGLLRETAGGNTPVSIWIPACATGEDAYSLALITMSMGLDARIVGSDLCEKSLLVARNGSYGPLSLRRLPAEFQSHFERDGKSRRIAERVRRRVTFQSQNLLEQPLSTPGGWNLILCRNVFIYFSAETAQSCAGRLGRALHPSGYALFGAGEMIGACPPGLSPTLVQGRVVFRRHQAPVEHGAEDETRISTVLPTLRRPEAARCSAITVPFAERRRLGARTPTEVSPRAPVGPHLGSEWNEQLLEKANRELSHASEVPLDPTLRMLSGIALYSAGDFDRSLHELRAASLLDSQLWPAAIYQGMCLESMGHPDLARAEYRHAVRILESSPELSSLLPDELMWLGSDLLEMARRKSA